MHRCINIISLLLLSSTFLFFACSKKEAEESTPSQSQRSVESKETKGKKFEYEKHVVKEIIKSDDCGYIISGVVEYLKDNVIVATIDYGDGTCDNLATKTVGNEVFEFVLDGHKKKEYKK